jgi:hypothetical protein
VSVGYLLSRETSGIALERIDTKGAKTRFIAPADGKFESQFPPAQSPPAISPTRDLAGSMEGAGLRTGDGAKEEEVGFEHCVCLPPQTSR